jgi:hypothetical protein
MWRSLAMMLQKGLKLGADMMGNLQRSLPRMLCNLFLIWRESLGTASSMQWSVARKPKGGTMRGLYQGLIQLQGTSGKVIGHVRPRGWHLPEAHMENLQLVALWTLAFTFTITMMHSVGLRLQDLGLSFISQWWSIQGNLSSDIIKQLNCQAIITWKFFLHLFFRINGNPFECSQKASINSKHYFSFNCASYLNHSHHLLEEPLRNVALEQRLMKLYYY